MSPNWHQKDLIFKQKTAIMSIYVQFFDLQSTMMECGHNIFRYYDCNLFLTKFVHLIIHSSRNIMWHLQENNLEKILGFDLNFQHQCFKKRLCIQTNVGNILCMCWSMKGHIKCLNTSVWYWYNLWWDLMQWWSYN